MRAGKKVAIFLQTATISDKKTYEGTQSLAKQFQFYQRNLYPQMLHFKQKSNECNIFRQAEIRRAAPCGPPPLPGRR